MVYFIFGVYERLMFVKVRENGEAWGGMVRRGGWDKKDASPFSTYFLLVNLVFKLFYKIIYLKNIG